MTKGVIMLVYNKSKRGIYGKLDYKRERNKRAWHFW